MFWVVVVVVWNIVFILIIFFLFFVYIVIEKKFLYFFVVFIVIFLFMFFWYFFDQFGDMIVYVQELKVFIDCIEEFFFEEEIEKFEQLGEDNIDENGERVIGFRNVIFIWGSKFIV